MRNSHSIRNIIFKTFPYLFYAALLVFLVLYLQTIDLSKLRTLRPDWSFLALASILALVFRTWGAYIWTVLLRSLGASTVRLTPTLLYVYAKSWLGRYIPGSAVWIIGKVYFASKQGISKNKLAVSSLLEGALQIIVQLLFAITILAFDSRLNQVTYQVKLLMIAAIAGLVLLLVPKVFNTAVSIFYRAVKRKAFSIDHYASGSTISKGFLLYVAGSVINSLSFFFIAKAIYPDLAYGDMLFVMGVTTLSSAVSMVAVFAPSGIGVREGLQLALLSIIMPTEIALAITVLSRLWSVAIDLIFFGIAWLLVRAQRPHSIMGK